MVLGILHSQENGERMRRKDGRCMIQKIPVRCELVSMNELHTSSHFVCGRELYRLMTSGIVPRPIAFVSSLSNAGVANLAPFR